MTVYLDKVINFLKHPSLHASLGLLLAGLAQFTATVPVKDRTTPTILGLGYSLANLILNKYSPKSA